MRALLLTLAFVLAGAGTASAATLTLDITGYASGVDVNDGSALNCQTSDAGRNQGTCTHTYANGTDVFVKFPPTQYWEPIGITGCVEGYNDGSGNLDEYGCKIPNIQGANTIAIDLRARGVKGIDFGQPVIGNDQVISGTVTQRMLLDLSGSVPDGVGVDHATFTFAGQTIGTATASPFVATLDTTKFPDGTANFTAQAVDKAGHVGPLVTRPWLVDNHAPTVTLTGPADNAVVGPGQPVHWDIATGDGSGSGVKTITCAFDGAAAGPCGTGTAGNLTPGAHTFTVAATDGAGLVGTAVRHFTIDATAPVASITSGPTPGATVGPDVTFGFTSDDAGATYACRTYVANLTPPAFGTCSGAGGDTRTGLADGTYAFEVRATDTFGNVGAAVRRTFTVTHAVVATPTPTVSATPSATPRPTVTPTATPRPTSTPTTAPAATAHIVSRFSVDGRETTVKRFSLSGLPAHSKVAFVCRGGKKRGCLLRRGTSGTVLAPVVKAGVKVTFTISVKGKVVQVITVRFRKGKQPRIATLPEVNTDRIGRTSL